MNDQCNIRIRVVDQWDVDDKKEEKVKPKPDEVSTVFVLMFCLFFGSMFALAIYVTSLR